MYIYILYMFPLRMIILNGCISGGWFFFPAALAIIPMQDPGGRHSMGKAQRRADLGLWHGEFPALWEQKHWEVGKSNGRASYFPMTVSLIVDKFFIFRQIQYIPILLQVLIIDQPEIVCRSCHCLRLLFE